jgi:hypothetical protein
MMVSRWEYPQITLISVHHADELAWPAHGEFAAKAKRSFHDMLGGGAIPAAMANVAVLGTNRSPSSFRSRFLQRALKAFCESSR